MLVTQLRPALGDPMDGSPPGSSVHGILQARILEWVVIPFSGDLPHPQIEPRSPALQADALPSEPPGRPLNERKQKQTPKGRNEKLPRENCFKKSVLSQSLSSSKRKNGRRQWQPTPVLLPGAWWAAVHGVAKSQTPLKQLSSSSSKRKMKPR